MPMGAELDGALSRLQRETSLWQSFLAAHRQLVELLADQMLRDHQLPLEWLDVLVHLADSPGCWRGRRTSGTACC